MQMQIEIKSPTEINLTPETALEESIIRDGSWTTKKVEPGLMEMNRTKLVISKDADVKSAT